MTEGVVREFVDAGAAAAGDSATTAAALGEATDKAEVVEEAVGLAAS